MYHEDVIMYLEIQDVLLILFINRLVSVVSNCKSV